MKKEDLQQLSEPSEEDVRYTQDYRVDPLTTMDQMKRDLAEINQRRAQAEEEKKLADEKLRLEQEEEVKAKLKRLDEIESEKRKSEDGTR